MRDETFDRRSVLKSSGALAGAGALGLLGTGGAIAGDGTTDGSGGGSGSLETASGVTEPEYEAGEPEELYVEVELTFENEDGETVTETPTLYGEIVRPVDPETGEPLESVPIVLTYTPYGDLYQALNDGESPVKDGIAEYFVPRGYGRAMFDLIGCRNSGGYYDYGGIRERLSGKELVDALAERDLSNGRLGMIGGSYDGTTQLAAAVETPEHLEAIIPQVAIDRWYDYRYFGGCPRSTVGTPTLFDFGFAAVPPRTGEPAHDVEATATRLEPGSRVEHEVRSYEYDPVYDEFWAERDYRERAENVDCAVMMEAGWEDRNVIRWGSTRFYEALADVGHEERRLVIGDWGHDAGQYPDSMDLYHAWFDHYLVDGVETDVESLPNVDVQSESSPRTQFDAWPPAETEKLGLPLVRNDADEGELELLGTGLAVWEDGSPPVDEDDMFDERGSGDDHLQFETPELSEDLRISGRVTADLLAASDDDTWYTAVVYERDADDEVRVFARGAWNSRFRNGVDEAFETPDDRAYRVGVECWDINWTVSAGSRLGVVIASDNDDYVRHDPSNESTNELVLGESALCFDGVAGDVDATTFPNVDLVRETERRVDVDDPTTGDTERYSVHTAGRAVRLDVTAESASDEALVRAPVPDDWTVVAGDDHRTYDVAGTTYLEFEDPIDEGETLTYFLESPTDTGEYEFGPVEYSSVGELWATADDTHEGVLVVGLDI